MLERMGYEVLVAADGHEALSAALARRPDVLFTDVVLPGRLNGPEVAREMRRRYPDLPVLLTSGYTGEADHPGEFELLHKPFRARDLEARLARLLQRT
jgi:CheY-like chemotaxis protein